MTIFILKSQCREEYKLGETIDDFNEGEFVQVKNFDNDTKKCIWHEAKILGKINGDDGRMCYTVLIIDECGLNGMSFTRKPKEVRKYFNANTIDTFKIGDKVEIKYNCKPKYEKIIPVKAKVVGKTEEKYRVMILDKIGNLKWKEVTRYPFRMRKVDNN